ncbi:MAG TPA: 30S ribosomal protein THX [Xanthomonadaceae bacterium]|nr:30S ribosomal protein THX [Xanthomonadaceae bacterium]
MGKGDRRTFRGKISIRSYGNARPHRVKPKQAAQPAVKGKPRKKA